MNTVEQISLHTGDTMLLFTDGIVEATDSNGKMFSEKQLRSVFEECGGKSTGEIRDCVLKSLEKYSTDDDVTLRVVKKK